MLTIDAILSKKFDKAMGGYRQDDVDTFLQQIAMDYEKLQNENQDLEEKLEILAEKIEQYRKEENGLKTALIGAQKLGEGLLKDAKRQAEQMRRDALQDIEASKLQLEREIQRERYELGYLQKETANFKNRLMSMYVAQMDNIRNIPVPESLQTQEETGQEAETEEAVPAHQEDEAAYAEEEVQEMPVTDHQPTPEPEEDEEPEDEEEYYDEEDEDDAPAENDNSSLVYEPSSSRLRQAQEESRFGPLKFGAGFEVANLNDGEEPRKKFSFKKNR